jgi:hypothetical protein
VKKNEAVKGLNRYFVSENKERVNLKIWGVFWFRKSVREKMEIGNNACDFEMFCEKLS